MDSFLKKIIEEHGTLLKSFTKEVHGREYMIEQWDLPNTPLKAFNILDAEGNDISEEEAMGVMPVLLEEDR